MNQFNSEINNIINIDDMNKIKNGLLDYINNFGTKVIYDPNNFLNFLIDLRNKSITGKEALAALEQVHITVNKNMVPFDDKSPFITSGIRVGVPAVTTRGLKENDMAQIVNWLDRVLMAPDDEALLGKVKGEVNEFMKGFPLYPEL